MRAKVGRHGWERPCRRKQDDGLIRHRVSEPFRSSCEDTRKTWRPHCLRLVTRPSWIRYERCALRRRRRRRPSSDRGKIALHSGRLACRHAHGKCDPLDRNLWKSRDMEFTSIITRSETVFRGCHINHASESEKFRNTKLHG